VLDKKSKPSNSTPIFRGWKRISLALEGQFLSFRPIKPRHVAESGGAIKAMPFGRFAALTMPPFFRLFVFVADGRECLRWAFEQEYMAKAERRNAKRQFIQGRNILQISCPELPLADPGQGAIWHSAITFSQSVFFGLRGKTDCPLCRIG